MADEPSILREQIARYRNLLDLASDAQARTILQRLIAEAQDRLDVLMPSRPRS
jgi:hypothetical protein